MSLKRTIASHAVYQNNTEYGRKTMPIYPKQGNCIFFSVSCWFPAHSGLLERVYSMENPFLRKSLAWCFGESTQSTGKMV